MGYWIKKVLMVGEPSVGKTSLVRRFVEQTFDEKYISSMGLQIKRKKITVGSDNLTMIISDLQGQHPRESLLKSYAKGTDGIIAVWDLTNEETGKEIGNYWLPEIYERYNREDIPVIVAANKKDLFEGLFFGNVIAPVTKLLEKKGYYVTHKATSAKTGEGVEDLFQTLGERLLEK